MNQNRMAGHQTRRRRQATWSSDHQDQWEDPDLDAEQRAIDEESIRAATERGYLQAVRTDVAQEKSTDALGELKIGGPDLFSGRDQNEATAAAEPDEAYADEELTNPDFRSPSE